MLVTELGMLIEVKGHPRKAELPILVRDVGRVIEVSFEQP